MTAEGLLVRRQGRGTFVAEAEDNSILFRFYRLTSDGSSAVWREAILSRIALPIAHSGQRK